VFSVVSARERRWFWATRPSRSLTAALALEALVGTALALVGLPGLAPLPWEQMAAIFGYALVSCLVVNDTLKVVLIKHLVPVAVA
ncbi:MAG: plasma-membrane proton-efflux P-type ATPase, partial [Gemmataceae bacterium]